MREICTSGSVGGLRRWRAAALGLPDRKSEPNRWITGLPFEKSA